MVDLPDSPAPVGGGEEIPLLASHSKHWALLIWQGRIHTEKQHLDLIPLHHLVALELVLDLLVTGLPFLVLGTHATTHYGGVW